MALQTLAQFKLNEGKTILFAEDDEAIRKFVQLLLAKCGYKTIVATNGKDALEKAQQFDGPIHLLLSDIEMPEMTGIELAIQMNRERPDTRILLISGLDSGMLLLNNGWQFLPKPFMADMLRDRVRDFLSEEPPIQEHPVPVQSGVVPVVPANGAPPLK
jgi:two-component system cell cycle sensor histidine kinase/response regulator CckA